MQGIFFAAAGWERQVNEANHGSSLDTKDMLLAVTSALAVAFAFYLWFYLRSRKQSREADEERLAQITTGHSKSSNSDEVPQSGDRDESGKGKRRRKRRRVREHRPRNPTLDQTGGLPPPRKDDQLPNF